MLSIANLTEKQKITIKFILFVVFFMLFLLFNLLLLQWLFINGTNLFINQ